MKKITNAGSFNPTSVATEVKSLDAAVAETIVKNSQNYNGVSYASIPLHLLHIPTYQRQLHSSVAKIAAAWDDKKCGSITVSFRDGKFYVIDGQHRVAAAKLAGRINIFSMILTGLSREDEINMFVNQNQNCKIVSAYDKIYAQSDGDIAPGAELVAMCKAANIKLKNRGSAGPGELACAAVLRNAPEDFESGATGRRRGGHGPDPPRPVQPGAGPHVSLSDLPGIFGCLRADGGGFEPCVRFFDMNAAGCCGTSFLSGWRWYCFSTGRWCSMP